MNNSYMRYKREQEKARGIRSDESRKKNALIDNQCNHDRSEFNGFPQKCSERINTREKNRCFIRIVLKIQIWHTNERKKINHSPFQSHTSYLHTTFKSKQKTNGTKRSFQFYRATGHILDSFNAEKFEIGVCLARRFLFLSVYSLHTFKLKRA